MDMLKSCGKAVENWPHPVQISLFCAECHVQVYFRTWSRTRPAYFCPVCSRKITVEIVTIKAEKEG